MKNIKTKLAIISISLLSAVFSSMRAQTVNVLNISNEIPPEGLIFPESFETDTKTMIGEWYLNRYAAIDENADARADVDVSDEVLIERLSKLPVEIEMPFNSVVKNSILLYANRRKQLVENMLALGIYYMPIFETALDIYKLPKELKYLPIIESALEPSAVSRAGAVGLWQFMAPTASGLGLEMNSLVDARRDPYKSTDAAARYLKQLYEMFNDWSLAIAAYNCGPGNVNKALRRAGDGKHDFWDIYPFLPNETRGYFPAFIAANYIMTYHNDHNIAPALQKRPVVTDTVHVCRRVHFQQISDVMDIPMAEIRALNPQYRQDVIPGDIHAYPLVLPSLQTMAYIVNEDSIVNHDAEKYARRDIVEPASGSVTGSDAKGEYIDEVVTQYHTVKRGETLAKIARRYGVTVAQIRKSNKIGKTVQRGQKLKIQTHRRKYIEKPQIQPSDTVPSSTPENVEIVSTITENEIVATDSVVSDTIPTPQTVAKAFEQDSAKETPAAPKKTAISKNQTPSTINYTVRKGDTLFKIAKTNGLTVDELKKANNMKDNGIKIGQRLKIPVK